MKTVCIILAAGQGMRMNSNVPKVLQTVCGVPMLQSVINTARKIRPDRIIVVTGRHSEKIRETVDSRGVSFAVQKSPKGTAHALMSAKPEKNFRGLYVVLNGDTPLLGHTVIKRFISLHRKDRNSISVLSFTTGYPRNYGRVMRDDSGTFVSIIEDKDTNSAQKRILEVNSGVYAINHNAFSLLDKIKLNRLKGEYYLTDIVSLAVKRGLKVSAYCIGKEEECIGVNTPHELSMADRLMRIKIIKRWISKGVRFADSDSVFIQADVRIGRETLIYPNVCIEGQTVIGKGAIIYPNVRITDSLIGNQAEIKDSTVIESSTVRNRASVGPFAHLRPGSDVGSDSRIGNFVELKKARIGEKTKASHLSYIGDAKIGKRVNIGAGAITCNYDGKKKHLTVIGDDVFVGSDSQLVAPVKVGKGAYIGAGSTITKDVPAWALALSRARQKKIPNWGKKRSGPKNKE